MPSPFKYTTGTNKGNRTSFSIVERKSEDEDFILAAFIGCIVAIGLAIQFDEIEDVEQFNSNLKERGDLPFLRKDEG